MKIALVIPTMDRGGAEKQVVLLAIGLHQAGHDVRVALLTRDGPRSEDLRAAGVPIEIIGKRFQADPTALLRLRRWLLSWHPDVVHTWLFAANSFGRIAAKTANVPIIIASERCVDLWKRNWHWLIDRKLQSVTDAITTNSEGVREFYSNHEIDPRLFEVIPNGIEEQSPNLVAIDREEAFRRLEVAAGRKLILAVGRLWPQKRIKDLIWAGELIATVRRDTTLVVIGDGPQRGELMRHREAVSRLESVKFAGNRDDVEQLLPHADVFWIASEYEGQSNAVIEAMRAGVPVVASNIPGNRDLITDNETGSLFEVGDEAKLVEKTDNLLNDPTLCNQFTAAARVKVKNEFSVQSMVDRHVSLYQRLIEQQSGIGK